MTSLVMSAHIVPGEAGYTYGTHIAKAWRDGKLSRMWGLGARVVSGQLDKSLGAGVWKSWDRMPTLSPELLDQLESIGVTHPSTYSDCYHQLAPSPPRIKHTYNGMFRWWRGGPWEEARAQGKHNGTWFRYDLRSAYRWAASLGLPDTRTFRACIHKKPTDVNGLWVGWCEPRADLPNVFRDSTRPVVMSSEEIRTYAVKFDVIRGVTWTKVTPPNYVDDTLALLPCAKESSRAFWGRWIARDPLRCWVKQSSSARDNGEPLAPRVWDLPNRTANFVWGWLVVGRVRLKVWQASRNKSAHIYVDELIVPHELETGNNPGDWHLKQRYDNGIFVKRTGCFGPLGGTPTMETGRANLN